MRIAIALRIAGAGFMTCSIAGCIDSSSAQVPPAKQPPRTTQSAPTGGGIRIIAHDEIPPVGLPAGRQPLVLRNPFDGNQRALATGAKLFIAYNCVDCHGADGAGAMGPTFQDGRWHFGGSSGAVFESIYQGRPEGMPSWGGRIADDQIWMLTAYVRSLATADLTTENFSGATVERTGH